MPAEVELKRRALACVDIVACRAAKTANTWLSFCVTPVKLTFINSWLFFVYPSVQPGPSQTFSEDANPGSYVKRVC
jgi:hypothetical protein